MNTRIIDTADAVVRRYKTRNPEEIISQRAIKLKDIRCCRDLLGYYTVMLNCEYIGINPNCTDAQRVPSEKPQKKIGCYVQNSTVRCAVTEEVNLS